MAGLSVVLKPGQRVPRIVERPRRKRPRLIRVRTIRTGIDGTDEGLLGRRDVELPRGSSHLVMGHEALGEVLGAPRESPFSPGDRVVPLVRTPCRHCAPCNLGRQDLCQTGRYVEAGIKGRHGFMQETWSTDSEQLVAVPKGLGDAAVLAEPLSIVVKAWETAVAMQSRLAGTNPRRLRVLVTGTGSLGSLACLWARQLGALATALDRHDERTAAARLLRRIGARHRDSRDGPLDEEFDLVIETTGATPVARLALEALAPDGSLVFLGVPHRDQPVPVSMLRTVLGNQAIAGSVNSSAVHFRTALAGLLRLQERWPGYDQLLLTHSFQPEEAAEALTLSGSDVVKKVLDW